MATLHVRNVPDALYEKLRTQATANGRSIGGEAIFQLMSGLNARSLRPGYSRARRRGSADKPFEHFSPRARQVVVDARDEAGELGHERIGTEHLLLALLRERTTHAARALEMCGLEHAQVRESVERALGRGDVLPSEQIPFTPGAKKALELALRESLDLDAPFIGPEHLLLGVAREQEGLGAEILAEHAQNADTLRACVRGLGAGEVFFEQRPLIRVIELEGDPARWESQLNEIAQGGYALVHLIDRRAIFQLSTPFMARRSVRT
jgi:plasmid stability protein